MTFPTHWLPRTGCQTISLGHGLTSKQRRIAIKASARYLIAILVIPLPVVTIEIILLIQEYFVLSIQHERILILITRHAKKEDATQLLVLLAQMGSNYKMNLKDMENRIAAFNRERHQIIVAE